MPDLFRESRRIHQITDAQSATSHLVFVRGANSAQCRADLSLAKLCLDGCFLHPMVGKDDMTTVGYHQPSFDRGPSLFDFFLFFGQRQRIQYDTIADDALHLRMKNAGRNQVKDMTLAADDYSVARVVASLIPSNAVELLRENIDDFAFSLIAPLQTDDGEICFHSDGGPGGLGIQMPVDGIGDLALIDETDDLFAYLAVLEEEQCGDAANVELRGSGTVGVHIELADLDATLEFCGNCIDSRSQSAARTATGSPEVDKNVNIGFQNLRFKIGISNFDCICTHDDSLAALDLP